MIIRVFKATIPERLHKEFESKFISISVPHVLSFDGLISITIGRPSKWNPDEFVMVSVWENERAIRKMAGRNWNKGYIPAGMEKYILTCSVDHFDSIAY